MKPSRWLRNRSPFSSVRESPPGAWRLEGGRGRGILEIADEEAVDLIIIGRQGVTHEMGDALDKFRSLVSGGVAEKISRNATIPVLMVV